MASEDQSTNNEYQVNTGRIPKRQLTHNFSPEVHVLACTLVPVVSTVHLVVRELIGTTPSPTIGRCWHFLAQSPSVEVLSPSSATALEMSVGIS